MFDCLVLRLLTEDSLGAPDSSQLGTCKLPCAPGFRVGLGESVGIYAGVAALLCESRAVIKSRRRLVHSEPASTSSEAYGALIFLGDRKMGKLQLMKRVFPIFLLVSLPSCCG